MSPSPRAPRSNRANPAVIPADADDSDMDPMDIVLGVVAAIAIPGIVYVLISALVGGGGDSTAESMRKSEELQNINPPVTFREIEMRIARVELLLQNQVTDYVRRANAAEENHEKNHWQELAYRVLGISRNELETVQADIPKSSEMRDHPEVDQAIERWLAHISSEEEKIRRTNPFPDRLIQSQANILDQRREN